MLKKIILFTVLAFCFFTVNTKERPKVGLVLSGGGAKGFAHVGVLKVLEELGIPIDYIGGTSIGSIVGGLYAIGYDAAACEQIIQEMDWGYVLSDKVDRGHIPFFEKQEMDRYNISFPVNKWKVEVPSSIIKGQNIINTFANYTYGYHDILDFSQFQIPFLCIAADLETGKEVVMTEGFLPYCMRASMSIPGAFQPQLINGNLCIDGGIINNFPVDRVREMGADIIIGVDLSTGLKSKEDLKSFGDVMGQLISVVGIEKYEKNLKSVDIYINPDMKGYGVSSFSRDAVDTLLVSGEEAARSVYEQLVELRDLLGVEAPKLKKISTPNPDTLMFLREIVMSGMDDVSSTFLKGKIGLKKGTYVSLQDVNNGINNLYGTLNFDLVNFRITGDAEKTLFVYLTESARNTLNAGFHYDQVNHAALLLNSTIRRGTGSGARLSTNLKLSRQPGFDMQYTLDRGEKPGYLARIEYRAVNFNSVIEDVNYLIDLNIVKGTLGTHIVFSDVFTFGLNASFETDEVKKVYSDGNSISTKDSLQSPSTISYSAFIKYDNLDNIYFPSSGSKLDASFRIITDDFIQFENRIPIMEIRFNYYQAISMNSKLTFIPSIYARSILWDKEIPYLYKTYMGGTDQNDYFGVQIPFYGLDYFSFPTNNSITGNIKVRYELWEKHYIGGIFNAAVYSSEKNIFGNPGTLYGGGLTYGHNSFIGPINIYLMSSNVQNSASFFVSIGYWF